MRKYKVLVSELAEKEIERIAYFIEEAVSPASAYRVTDKIWQSILTLETFPRRGMKVEESPELRISSVRKYKYYLLYDVDDKTRTVTIHHVVHQHQELGQFVLD